VDESFGIGLAFKVGRVWAVLVVDPVMGGSTTVITTINSRRESKRSHEEADGIFASEHRIFGGRRRRFGSPRDFGAEPFSRAG